MRLRKVLQNLSSCCQVLQDFLHSVLLCGEVYQQSRRGIAQDEKTPQTTPFQGSGGRLDTVGSLPVWRHIQKVVLSRGKYE